MLAISVKRLHDLNLRGWWVLVLLIVEAMLTELTVQSYWKLISSGINVVIGAVSQTAVEDLIGYAILIGVLVVIGIPRGTAETNWFGPDPLKNGTRGH
jgi:uncharacterized membrane protein YhaH (DUF805 family)